MKSLRAVFLTDDMLRLFTGARCQMPTGEVVEFAGRRTPFYDLARELDARGYGECQLQIYTPTGTPSLRGGSRTLPGWLSKKAAETVSDYAPIGLLRAVERPQTDGTAFRVPDTGKAEIGLSGAIPIRPGGGVRECRLTTGKRPSPAGGRHFGC